MTSQLDQSHKMAVDEDLPMSGTATFLPNAQRYNSTGSASLADLPMSSSPPSAEDDDDDDRSSESGSELSNFDGHANTVHSEQPDSFHTKRSSMFMGVVIPTPMAPALPYSSSQSGVVYDARMRFHTELELDDDDEIHPEDPRRIHEIFDELVKAGLAAPTDTHAISDNSPFKLFRVQARHATPAEICLVHSREHYAWMETLEGRSDADLVSIGKGADSLYLHQNTLSCARLSAGGAIEACRHVVGDQVKNAIAVIRPPGHHAEHDKPGGFCFFNNVAIAAKVCQHDFGDRCRKILIVDWDVHHGNGVQQAFEDNPNVLYISLHVYNNGTFYPQGDYGDHHHVGIGAGTGKNINIPWPTPGMGDGDYIHAFQQIVMPCAQEFDPDLVIISAGFDAAEGDTLGGCHVTPGGFAHMTSMLMTLANGKVVACLEGGYNLRSIAKSALAVTRTLMGEAPERLSETVASAQGADTVRMVKNYHSKFWKCLFPKDKAPSRLRGMGGERLHDILRKTQAHEWGSKFNMDPLYIYRDKLSPSFENEVLATSNFTDDDVPMLIIFHDPPETIGEQNAHTGTFEPHNIIVTDVAKQYVEWACKNGFAVIDVNIPKYLTDHDDTRGYIEDSSEEVRTQLTRDLASYLWDNYIEVFNTGPIFLMGIGAAYRSIVWLISNQESAMSRIEHVFNFVSVQSLVPAQRPADDQLAMWYHQNSDVFVAHNHACWYPEKVRRIRKKYGNLVQSSYDDLSEMLLEQRDAVLKKMLGLAKICREAERTEQAKPESQDNVRSSNQLQDPSAALQYSHDALPVRSSPPASPALKSPVKMPPTGMFTVSSPAGKVSPDKEPSLGQSYVSPVSTAAALWWMHPHSKMRRKGGYEDT